uniref:Uncharacterized protein n=1 Tax=Anguilla anguilla TaxID=7936 RepID=A0A0E9VHG7_ANGAN
MLKLETIFCRY